MNPFMEEWLRAQADAPDDAPVQVSVEWYDEDGKWHRVWI